MEKDSLAIKFQYRHGLSVMRFQPFHNGHVRVIDTMLSECAFVTIVIGSIQEKGTERNPFDFFERKKMIEEHYRNSADFQRLGIVGIKDLGIHLKWAEYVIDAVKEKIKNAPEIEAFYCGSKHDGRLFENKGLQIIVVDRLALGFPLVSGAIIRNMCSHNDDSWRDLVPKSCFDLIEKKLMKTVSV
jgi:nicotinamide-nucleotide adenylyltransferase